MGATEPSTEPPGEFPKIHSSSSGTDFGYYVEARLQSYKPDVIAGQILDPRWRRVDFVQSPIGVPNPPHCPALMLTGLYSYQAAQALRWWFHAEARKDHQDLCLETRLVMCEIHYSHTAEAISAHEYVGHDYKRSTKPDKHQQEILP